MKNTISNILKKSRACLARLVLRLRIKRKLRQAKMWTLYAKNCNESDLHKTVAQIYGEQKLREAKDLMSQNK